MTAVVEDQVQPAEYPTAALNAAQARLATAVAALLQPGDERIERDRVARDHGAADAEREHAEVMTALRRRHAAYAQHRGDASSGYVQGRDAAGMRRTLTLLIAREQAHQAAQRARHVGEGHLPSLLDQLHDAVQSTQGGGGCSAGVHRWGFGVDAAALLSEIRAEVTARRGDDLAARIRSWAGLAGHWRTTVPQRLLDAAVLAEGWVRSADEVLNPRRRMTAVGACPRCHLAVVHVTDDGGDTVRRPALEIDVTTGWARCIAQGCGASWPPERLQLLASVLEQQAREQQAREQEARARLDAVIDGDHPMED